MRTRAAGVRLARRVVPVAVAVLAGLGLASCSDDDGRLTRAELTARGDGICRKLDADVKKLASSFEATIIFPPEQMQELFTKMVPLVDGAIKQFKDLEPPEDLEAKYAAVLDQIDKDREKLVAGTQSPEAAKQLFDAQVDPFESTNQKLAAVGITACAGEGAAQGDAEDEGAATTSTIGAGAGTGTSTSTSASETTATTTATTAAP